MKTRFASSTILLAAAAAIALSLPVMTYPALSDDTATTDQTTGSTEGTPPPETPSDDSSK